MDPDKQTAFDPHAIFEFPARSKCQQVRGNEPCENIVTKQKFSDPILEIDQFHHLESECQLSASVNQRQAIRPPGRAEVAKYCNAAYRQMKAFKQAVIANEHSLGKIGLACSLDFDVP